MRTLGPSLFRGEQRRGIQKLGDSNSVVIKKGKSKRKKGGCNRREGGPKRERKKN